ncbi:hypothetical protein CYD30_28010 [Kosakonia cowanii]|nr:hypothetical protein CYD30_28010 [Kosakonia cowanii]
MTDFYAFNDWLWRCDPRLAARVQTWHDLWKGKLRHHQQTMTPRGNSFTVDGRYRVEYIPRADGETDGFALHCLTDPGSPVAIYQSAGPLFADLIAHSIRRTNHLTAEDFDREARRLLELCHRAWAEFAGGGV